MIRLAVTLGALALVLSGCSSDDDPSVLATDVTVTLGEPLPVGSSYEDPAGLVTLTVRGVRLTGGMLLADAEACADADGLPAVPVQSRAWQLRVRGREQTIPAVTVDDPTRAARPPWPETVELAAGDCVEGKVAFRLPDGARPDILLFTQLNEPVAWRIRT